MKFKGIQSKETTLEACSAFKTRICHEIQAPRMVDIWPIENVWAILKAGVKAKEPKSKAQLKKVINQVWRQMDSWTGIRTCGRGSSPQFLTDSML